MASYGATPMVRDAGVRRVGSGATRTGRMILGESGVFS